MSWKAEYIILIIISTLIDYIAGINIYNTKSKNKKKFFLGLSLCSNLGILFLFKYFNFFSDSIRTILQQFSIQLNPITLKFLLPVGISFYTFQTLSYTIDVYNNKIKPEKHLGIFAVYVSFFPQLVAGPIERAKNLLPQFKKKIKFNETQFTDGLKLMLFGFFKKVVIADRLAIIVNTVYNNPTNYTGILLILATFFFAFQIYCDFSGYSDIAIGVAKTMGFTLMDNFKRPYFSKSVSEFWKRWHISLSTWFKDYLYIPLGGNRVSKLRRYMNLFVVFLVSGLWHGANWTFVIWGALHGIYLILGIIFNPLKQQIKKKIKFRRLYNLFQIIFTFILVDFAWIFFRSNTIKDAFYIIRNLFVNLSLNFAGINLGVNWLELFITFLLIFIIIFIQFFKEKNFKLNLRDKPLLLNFIIYIIVILLIMLFGVFSNTQFIYFQF